MSWRAPVPPLFATKSAPLVAPLGMNLALLLAPLDLNLAPPVAPLDMKNSWCHLLPWDLASPVVLLDLVLYMWGRCWTLAVPALVYSALRMPGDRGNLLRSHPPGSRRPPVTSCGTWRCQPCPWELLRVFLWTVLPLRGSGGRSYG